ncbi:MAG: HAD-IB family phosphatase [Actinomycetota bacterium]
MSSTRPHVPAATAATVGAVVVDFDGTACLHDVAEHLLDAFAREDWTSLDEAWQRGTIGAQDVVAAQSAMLDADRQALIDHALAHCVMDPTFAPFVTWAQGLGIEVALASDGFGFYIEPMLAAAGVPPIPVITNDQTWTDAGRPGGMVFGNRHPECIGCGTCKMLAVLERRQTRGAVAFVGEGSSDRYGALYADVTFAKLDLVAHCERDGVPFVPWTDFDDVRHWLEAAPSLPGPVAPERCPGWTVP